MVKVFLINLISYKSCFESFSFPGAMIVWRPGQSPTQMFLLLLPYFLLLFGLVFFSLLLWTNDDDTGSVTDAF